MDDAYKAFYYYRCQNSKIALLLMGFVLPVIHLLTLEESEPVNYKYIVIPVILSLLAVFLISSCRKIMLGKLLGYDLDFKAVYELERRKDKPKNKYYNLKLLANLCFFSGDFPRTLACSSELLTSEKSEDRCYAMHMRILALFIMGDFTEILTLIDSQEKLLIDMKIADSNNHSQIYSFIKSFIQGEYKEAISVANKILSQKDMEKLNHRKILIFYFLRMTYIKLNDTENAKMCANQIIACDPNRNSFFRFSVEQG